MTHSPPLDQRIVDEYFRLASKRGQRNVAWLYGMVATFGVPAEHFRTHGWCWEGDGIVFDYRKTPIQPIHPQWMVLFQLKEKEPQDFWSSIDAICAALYQGMAHQKIKLNISDLLMAHAMRTTYYKTIKQPQPRKKAAALALAVVS